MRSSYDSIVIDTPPVTTMADAAVLSGFCDGVILVVHGQRTPVGLARQAMERLAVVQARILGVVLNGVDIRNPEYAYYQSYNSYVDSSGAISEQENGSAQTNGRPKSNGHAGNGDHPRDSHQPVVENTAQNYFSETDSCLAGEMGSEQVPPVFFEELLINLRKAVGPMAPIILQDHIRKLGGNREAFPKAHLQELIDRLCQEIINDEFKGEFLKNVQVELKVLSS
jgi:hypothetical protein